MTMWILTPSRNLQWVAYCAFLMMAFSCHPASLRPKASQQAQHDTFSRKNNLSKLSEPKVIFINPAHAPKWVKAGQPYIHADISHGGAIPLTTYTADQGLAMNSVTCGFQDHDGNLWFGTYGGGISRFDGSTFTNYTSSQGLAGNGVWSILEQPAGDLWFATNRGISKYDGRRFITYDSKDGVAGNEVKCVFRDADGNLWFGTNDGVSKYNGKEFTNYRTEQGLASNHVACVCEDVNGNLWFGSDGEGVSKFDGSSFTKFSTLNGLISNNIESDFTDSRGNIWFCTDKGISKYDGQSFFSFTTADGLVDNETSCVTQDHSGNLWIGTHNGISQFDGTTFTNFKSKPGLRIDNISHILVDKDDNIWICTYGGGFSRFDGKFIRYWTKPEGLHLFGAWGILQDDRHSYWFAANGGVVTYNGHQFKTYTTKQGLAGNDVHYLVRDKRGYIWFGTDRGLSCFDGKRFKTFAKRQGLPGNQIWSLLEDRQGNLWVGTDGSGISKFDGKSFTNYSTDQGLAGNRIWSIIQDKAGNLWFGSHDGGVSKFDGQSFTNFNTANGLAKNGVYSMAEDPFGNIWFGTEGGGAIKYDGRHFTDYTTKNGLPDNTVYAIAVDSFHQMVWFGTNQGISGIDFHNIDPTNPEKLSFQNFGMKTGYQINDLNVNALFVDPMGKLWGGTSDKLFQFDYPATRRQASLLTVTLHRIKVNNADICWNGIASAAHTAIEPDSLTVLNEMVGVFGRTLSDTEIDSMRKKFSGIRFDSISSFFPIPANLVLPYSDNSIDVEWGANELLLPKQVRYKYWLTGYNKGWSSPEANTRVSFGNIPEGRHTLRLMAIGPSEATSEVRYDFTVLPPWYRTWWAFVLDAILLTALAWLLVRWRTKSLKQEKEKLEKKVEKRTEQLREKEIALRQAYNELKDAQDQVIQLEKLSAQMNPHFVFNALNTIQSFIYSDNKKSATKYLGKFSDLMRKVLDNSSKSTVTLAEEIELLGLYLDLENSRFGEDFNARIEIEPGLNLENIEVPPMLIQPYVENSIKHGLLHQQGEKILVTKVLRAPAQGNAVEIRITDNGIGRTRSREINRSRVNHNPFATQANEKRIEIFNRHHHTNVKIAAIDEWHADGTAAGTTVSITIPI